MSKLYTLRGTTDNCTKYVLLFLKDLTMTCNALLLDIYYISNSKMQSTRLERPIFDEPIYHLHKPKWFQNDFMSANY